MNLIDPRDIPAVTSFQSIRRTIGFLGILLPLVLLAGGYLVGCHTMMSSISHYYYTYLVTIFTGTLCAVGLFLITYKGFGPLDDFATNFAGFCAFGVALFPTTQPQNKCSIYSPQFTTTDWWIHYIFAGGFFITLAMISLFLFTRSNKEKTKTVEKKRRNKIYRVCGILMILFCILVPILSHTQLNNYNSTFILEMLALWAFGVSWLTKGELISADNNATRSNANSAPGEDPSITNNTTNVLTQQQLPSEWDDWTKWKMDLLKTVLSTALSVVLTICIITLIISRNEYKWQTTFYIKTKVLQDYDAASKGYWYTAYDALKAAYKGETRESNSTIQNWQDKVNDDIKNATDNMHVWFQPDSNKTILLAKMDSARDQLHNLFKNLKNMQPRPDSVLWDSTIRRAGKEYIKQNKQTVQVFHSSLNE